MVRPRLLESAKPTAGFDAGQANSRPVKPESVIKWIAKVANKTQLKLTNPKQSNSANRSE